HELGLHNQTGQLIRDVDEMTNPNARETTRLFILKRMRNQGNPFKFAGDSQGELTKDTAILIQQILDLKKSLPDEQKLRVAAMQKLAVEFRLQENLAIAAQNLQAPAYVANRVEKIRSANDLQ